MDIEVGINPSSFRRMEVFHAAGDVTLVSTSTTTAGAVVLAVSGPNEGDEAAICAQTEISVGRWGCDLSDYPAGKYVLEFRNTTSQKVSFQLGLLAASPFQQTLTNSGTATRPEANALAIVDLLYATDRRRNDDLARAGAFGGERGTLSFGTATVSVPTVHQTGAIEMPSIFKLEFTESASSHFVIRSTQPMSGDRFWQSIGKSASTARTALVFVHGYNVTFDEAVRRMAQMVHDLKFKGVPILYSWASAGSRLAYPTDEANVELTYPRLGTLLSELAARPDIDSIWMVAHSMGSRALTRAFVDSAGLGNPLAQKTRQLILAAPDIDYQVFEENLAPRLRSLGVPVTLYVSSGDIALLASRFFHSYGRLGGQISPIFLSKGIDTIDASRVSTDLVGHTYFTKSRSVISDIFDVVESRLPPERRFNLRQANSVESVKHWEFKP
ncbi:MAG: alpha/beta hydrolase [Halothiobacillaceae bacterium]|nr:alpha/beta hydrolase [Halothiobacillaceae bacterium]